MVLLAAVLFSLVRARPVVVGEGFLAVLDGSHTRMRGAILLVDYSPDEVGVERAAGQITERGDGAADDYGVHGPSDASQHWVKTADATFSWRRLVGGMGLRGAIREAVPRLSLAIAHGALDDGETDRAVKSALVAIDGMSDEALFLAWVNADRGVLAQMAGRREAVRESLLLLAMSDPGPILTFNVNGHPVYIVPEESTKEVAWCRLESFDAGGGLMWEGVLRVAGRPKAERVRTVAVMMAAEALGVGKFLLGEHR